jgi:sensor domain CHASE-containing protein
MITLVRFAPWLLTTLAAAVAGFLWWQNGRLHEENGALQRSNAQMSNAIQEKEDALKSRQRTNAAVKRMAPADKLERLR